MNNTGKKFGGRAKSTTNKLTAEVKKKVQSLLNGAIDSINLSECTTAERIRLIESGTNLIFCKLCYYVKAFQRSRNVCVSNCHFMDYVQNNNLRSQVVS